jgi:type IV pilus assembly protein PilV
MSRVRTKARARAAAGRRAYTMIEVMIALGVLALGATGVIAMQTVTLIGNQRAKAEATATMIAQTWVERLRADAVVWNNPNGVSDLNETRWLQYANANPTWFAPDASRGGIAPYGSAMADTQGQDIYAAEIGNPPGSAATQAFCTLLRLYPLTTGPAGTPVTYIRAEVQVYWAKGTPSGIHAGKGITGRPVTCADDTSTGYGFVFATTGITPNNLPN